MSKHTRGRWRIGRYPEVIETAGKHDICIDMPNGGIYILAACNANFMDDARANARRIVACVNACEGLPNEELEAEILPIVTDRLQRQRDELLEFAQEVHRTGDARLTRLAMAVIAKATGSSDSYFHTEAHSHAEPIQHNNPNTQKINERLRLFANALQRPRLEHNNPTTEKSSMTVQTIFPENYGPCAKARIRCTLVTPTGEQFVGENWCENPQATCPRLPGEDYTKCTTICKQVGHAETVALMLAGEKAKGARAYLQFHTYACRNCQESLFDAGVESLSRKPPPTMSAVPQSTSAMVGQPNHMGFMYLAKTPCGKVSAAAWDEPASNDGIQLSIAKWKARGDTVERIERFKGDPMPEWACQSGEQCQCTASTSNTSSEQEKGA